jgi:hypothetical protein
LYSNTVGIDNTAVGDYALRSNISGNDNTATGFFALNLNTSGSNNTANGTLALKSNTTGVNNTALGYNAGFLNATGSGNVFLGNQAGYNETGSNKLIINNSQSSTPLISGDFSTKNISINTLTPHNSAVFEVSSTSKGVLLPRLTQDQILAISSPDTGLIVFNNTSRVYLIYTGSQWRELTMGGCIPSPSPAIAGNNQTVCNYPITLNATSPAVGTGKWTIESGLGGIIADSLNPLSSFTGSQGVEYTLKWTVSTSCNSNSATIKILKPVSLNVDAGQSKLNICGNEIQLNASLPPAGYTGTWTIINGQNGRLYRIEHREFWGLQIHDTIDAPEKADCFFKGDKLTNYLLKWTVSNNCISKSDSINISYALNPTTANAGQDISVTSPFVLAVTLSGNTPNAFETGTWTCQSGTGSFSSKHSPNSFFYVNPNKHYVLSWTISGPCQTTTSQINVNTGAMNTVSLLNMLFDVYTISDNADSIVWGGDSIFIGAISDSNGMFNTNLIVNTLGNNNGIPYAAKVCYDLSYGGHDDWYLPSIVELKQIVLNHSNELPNFSNNITYLSSTEISSEKIATYFNKNWEDDNSYNWKDEDYSKSTTISYFWARNTFTSEPNPFNGDTYTINSDIKGVNGNNSVRCIRKQ